MTRRAVIVSVDLYRRVVPLVGGYLHASAWLDPRLRQEWGVDKHVRTTDVSPELLAGELLEKRADVYGFSCYVWNTRLFRRALTALYRSQPDAHVILGGPQVMHCAEQYLSPETPNLVVCNGEGELTFRHYLEQLSAPSPDLSRVRGLSFYRGSELVTTEDEARIEDLDTIPSPFVNGYLDSSGYLFAHLETNRGCPFKCEYCYWGGAIGARVHKMSVERVKGDITWLAENKVLHVFIVDANWGMLERDVELAHHFAACRREYGYPREVTFASAKNSPERVRRITEIFYEADLLAAPSIAIQSLSERALAKVSRSNIKLEAYERLQKDLGSLDMTSFAELIWPLPGETLDSFRDGITRLCGDGVDCIMIYPLLLMNNVGLNPKKTEYGIATEQTSIESSEEEIVVRTKEVSPADYLEGWRLMFATILLYNLRGLYCLAHYLHHRGIRRYGDLFSDFLRFIGRPGASTAAKRVDELCRTSFALRTIVTESFGRVVHHVCHQDRELVDTCLYEFASSQPWWRRAEARAFLEADLLNRVYVYADTEKRPKPVPLRALRVAELTPRGYLVEVPSSIRGPLRDVLGARATFAEGPIHVNHEQRQWPLDRVRPDTFEQWGYCAHKMVTVREMVSTWEKGASMPSPASEMQMA